MRTLLWIFLLAATVLADRIHLKNDRVLEGQAKQDGDYWIIKSKIGTVRIHKDEVERVEFEDGSSPSANDPGEGVPREDGAYQSFRDGYSFRLPGKGWRIDQDPPRPMVSVVASNDSLRVEISVVKLQDGAPTIPLSMEAAQSLQPYVEALFGVSTRELSDVELERFPIQTREAYRFRAKGKWRLTDTHIVLHSVLFKAVGYVWILQYEAVVGASSEAEAAFYSLVDTFSMAGAEAAVQATRRVFTSGPLAFSIQAPEGWTIEGKEGEGFASVSLSSPDARVEATLDAQDMGEETDLHSACASLFGRLQNELVAFEASDPELATVGRLPVKQFEFSYRREGVPRAGVGLVTREGTRVFQVVVRSATKADARTGVTAILAGLRVLGKTASVVIPAGCGYGAIKTLLEADEEYAAQEYRVAEALYRKATREWPKFGHASLMLAHVCLYLENVAEAIKAAETARTLLGGRPEVLTVLASAYARQAKNLALDREYKKAADALCRVGPLKVRNETVDQEVKDAVEAFTNDVEAAHYADVWNALKKVNAAIPKNEYILVELARACVRVIENEMEAGNYDKAMEVANEGLKLKPKDAGIMEMIELIEEAKGEEK